MRFKSFAKKSLVAVLSGTMVLSLASCSGKPASNTSSTASTANNSDVTLQFQQWWEEELPAGDLAQICSDFTTKTGIKIKLLSNPYADTKTQIAAGAAAGTMADVVGLDGSWVYDFAKQGSLSSMTDLMKADSYDDTQLSTQIKVDEKTYMIPVVNFAYPMFVNNDILKSAGITSTPKTWSEFLTDCKAVTNKSKNQYGWIIQMSDNAPSGIQNCFMSWLWASGGSMLKDGKPNLTGNANMTKTVDFVKSMFAAGVVAPGATSLSEADMTEQFTNGRIAFMTDSLAHLTTIKKENPNLNFSVMSVPKMDGYTGKSGMDVANWGIGVASNSKYQKQAMQFIEYLMSPEVNAKLAVYANAFPGNTKATPDYSNSDAQFVNAYNIYTKDCYAINEFTGIPTSEDLMRSYSKQLQLYLNGNVSSVDTMLATIQNEWVKAFK